MNINDFFKVSELLKRMIYVIYYHLIHMFWPIEFHLDQMTKKKVFLQLFLREKNSNGIQNQLVMMLLKPLYKLKNILLFDRSLAYGSDFES